MTQPEKKLVYRAGLIPYIIEEGSVRMMFMRPSDPDFGGDKYQIAKGKIEDGESPLVAALREAKEEIGLFVGNVIITEEVGQFMGRTTVFVSKIKDTSMFGEPSFETSETTWMSLDEFLEDGRELHRPVVKAAHRTIMKMEDLNNV
ncbi:NUDIX hydrolase [Candidatus Thorarchaeota archaeon]|nr:MAG: NUDIX hydrolase [Candidatus Thorarchaeota archaeon]